MYPCPGGCGQTNDTGSWCGQCTWVALHARVTVEQMLVLKSSWPFDWTVPAKAFGYGPEYAFA